MLWTPEEDAELLAKHTEHFGRCKYGSVFWSKMAGFVNKVRNGTGTRTGEAAMKHFAVLTRAASALKE